MGHGFLRSGLKDLGFRYTILHCRCSVPYNPIAMLSLLYITSRSSPGLLPTGRDNGFPSLRANWSLEHWRCTGFVTQGAFVYIFAPTSKQNNSTSSLYPYLKMKLKTWIYPFPSAVLSTVLRPALLCAGITIRQVGCLESIHCGSQTYTHSTRGATRTTAVSKRRYPAFGDDLNVECSSD